MVCLTIRSFGQKDWLAKGRESGRIDYRILNVDDKKFDRCYNPPSTNKKGGKKVGNKKWGRKMTKETIEQVLRFRDERNWKQFHNPKDLAISICLEAAELLEVFQWSAEDVWCEEKKDKIREELADVLNYCILMADTCGLDMDEIIQEKVRKNAEKYPVEKAYGHKEKYTELGE